MRTPLDAGDQGHEKFDTSGKSPAHIQHRKKFGARARKWLRAFLNLWNLLNPAGL
jgi:hypothetical protein